MKTDAEMVREAIASLFQEAAAASRALRDEEAEQIYRRILSYLPDEPIAQYNLATTLLRMGRYEEGWKLYEARTEVGLPNVVRPEFKGPSRDR